MSSVRCCSVCIRRHIYNDFSFVCFKQKTAYEMRISDWSSDVFSSDLGAQQLFQIAGGDVVRTFILPPSMEELHQRLLKRATDTIEVIDARMQRAANEVSHWDGYEYVLVNDDVEECFTSV